MTLEQIKKKEVLSSKSWKYLGATLRGYGKDFLYHLRNIYCIATGIGDHKMTEITGVQYDGHLFLLCDADIKPNKFKKAVDFFRDHEGYEIDYPFEHPKLKLHMLVFKIPKQYKQALHFFKKSKYSEMFTEQQLSKLFYPSERRYDFYKVLERSSEYKEVFEDELNKLNGLTDDDASRITLDDEAELDYQVKLQEEIFNYDNTSLGQPA